MPKPTFFNLPEAKRARLIDEAVAEFAEHDYRNASISSVAARAGIAKGSLYQYFDDKRDLYLYLIQLAGEEKRAFLSAHPPPDPGMDVFAYLRWLIGEGARFELRNPLLARVAYRALFSDRPFGDAPFDALRQAAAGYYAGLVETGVRQGVIDPAVDRGLAVFVFEALFSNFGRYAIQRAGFDAQSLADGALDYQSLDVERLAGEMIEILRRGLAPRGA